MSTFSDDDDDAGHFVCSGRNEEERDVQSTCDANMQSWPNAQTGIGYYAVDLRCRDNAVPGCVPSFDGSSDPSMCRLCHVKVDGFEEGSTDYVQCPSCVCAKFGLDMDACKPVPKEPRHLHCSARNAEEFEVVDMCDRVSDLLAHPC